MKAHSIDQTAAWAKSWNIKGYEHLYPENREKNRQLAIKSYNSRQREKLNKSVTQR
tara:strand:+ start:1028 stop:1195 length:168 start_codon:yes stop_codon:yes gene_type:complete